jgi:hypothetical protein
LSLVALHFLLVLCKVLKIMINFAYLSIASLKISIAFELLIIPFRNTKEITFKLK